MRREGEWKAVKSEENREKKAGTRWAAEVVVVVLLAVVLVLLCMADASLSSR